MESGKKKMIIAITIVIAMIFIVSSYSQSTGRFVEPILKHDTEKKSIQIKPKGLLDTKKPQKPQEPTIPQEQSASANQEYEDAVNKITESYQELKEGIDNLEKIKQNIETQNKKAIDSEKRIKEFENELNKTKKELQELKEIKDTPENNNFYFVIIALNIGGLGILISYPRHKMIAKRLKNSI